MIDLILAVCSVYTFIVVGYFAKSIFKEQINEKSFVILSVYFMQPFLAFWGLTKSSITSDVLYACAVFISISIISLIIIAPFAKKFFKDRKDASIITVCGVIGNTGNLGIPLGIALFGEASIIYTSSINFANVFIVYVAGVYFYSRGNFSVKTSILNILKMPVIWFSIVAIVLNIYDIDFHKSIDNMLQMGGYAMIVLQLTIFGAYAKKSVENINIDYKFLSSLGFVKLIFIPLIGVLFLKLANLDSFSSKMVLLEIIVPLAISNVNLAALYNCNEEKVTVAVLCSSLIFIPYLLLFFDIMLKIL